MPKYIFWIISVTFLRLVNFVEMNSLNDSRLLQPQNSKVSLKAEGLGMKVQPHGTGEQSSCQ